MSRAAQAVPAEDINGDGRWLSMHNRFLLETKEKEPEVIFIGDSIIQNLVNSEMWIKDFIPLHSLNFGIGGDQTQHVLWRIKNGELDHVNPKVVVLHVGTNNLGFTPEEIVEGIMEIVNVIQEKQPEAYIVVLNLLPRGQHPNPLRERNTQVNKLLGQQLHGKPRCEMLISGQDLVAADGTISHHDMYDYLHLTQAGYRKVFDPLHELLQQLLLTEGEERSFAAGDDDRDLTPSE
ncbi:platelet-activating factor acetylhydrolase IB subunit alpha1 [Schistocerca gregaria]|uniref:platelet-activating factor acetylhydrolase IB subunit alpha1 n=1 Tax=Schistocerca gregaria TaxID=7010 RepID=UPI00211E5D3E|nr:platelet-activating factor acetylhydrolase IB subunit alpha1 [Schistocerca gregaria]